MNVDAGCKPPTDDAIDDVAGLDDRGLCELIADRRRMTRPHSAHRPFAERPFRG